MSVSPVLRREAGKGVLRGRGSLYSLEFPFFGKNSQNTKQNEKEGRFVGISPVSAKQ
jgi:hypothetical protein